MTKRETAALRTRVMQIIDKWAALGLADGYRIDVVFSDERCPKDTADLRIFADCTPDWRYLFAGINIYLPSIAEQEDLEETLVHELVHIALSVMSHTATDAEEHATTVLSRVLVKASRLGR